jgi:hypothetical protein
MKNPSLFLFSVFFVLLVFPVSSFAVGGIYDPIHIQIEENPQQILKSVLNKSVQYVAACSSLYDKISSYKQKAVGMSDPMLAKQTASYLEYLFGLYSSCVSTAASLACPSGTMRITTGGACLTPDAACKQTHGANSVFSAYDPKTGGYSCGCATGYVVSGNSCITTPQKNTAQPSAASTKPLPVEEVLPKTKPITQEAEALLKSLEKRKEEPKPMVEKVEQKPPEKEVVAVQPKDNPIPPEKKPWWKRLLSWFHF